MSLLGHLVRVTLTPEQAAKPALPQQFSNWGGAGGTDDGEWGEEAGDPEAPRSAPRTAPTYDDPFAAHPGRSPTDLEPGPSAEMPRRSARRQPVAFPEIAVPSLPPVQRSRVAEPTVEEAPAAQAPDPIAEQAPARIASSRSAPPQFPANAGQAPSPRVGRRPESAELPTTEPARPAPPQPVRAADSVAAIPVAAEPARAMAPDVVRAPVDIPSRPARHDPPAQLASQVSPSASDLRRDRPRLEEPRIFMPSVREVVPAPASPPAAPLIVPVAAPPAAAPILATPQVTLPDSAPERPQLPDVHISIGRVEVRAAAAPPPRQTLREASSKSATLSLDAYLSRRNGTAR